MATVPVDLAESSYHIDIEADLLSEKQTQQKIPQSQKYAIISQQAIADLYLSPVKKLLPDDASVTVCLVPDSETSKSREQYFRLLDILLEANFNRSSTIIALGGGVVGDLAGFVAATLHRGCNLVQIPTSLLAQVDSSVGGKTAINHPLGKNLIGSFYQPKAVLIDPGTLKTLDPRHFSAGMAEVIKYAFIAESDFLPWLENNASAIKNFDFPVLESMIGRCCKIKAAVVSADEKEMAGRVLLNFGHTFGHAIENISAYEDWLHGEAVAVGMLLAAKLSVDHGLMANEYFERLKQLLIQFNLPVELPASMGCQELLNSMYRDKKNLQHKLQLVLPREAGRSELVNWDDESALVRLLNEFGASQ